MFAAINMKFYGKANLHLHLTLRDTLNQSETRPAAYFVFPHIFSIAVIYTVIMGLQPEILIKENIQCYFKCAFCKNALSHFDQAYNFSPMWIK